MDDILFGGTQDEQEEDLLPPPPPPPDGGDQPNPDENNQDQPSPTPSYPDGEDPFSNPLTSPSTSTTETTTLWEFLFPEVQKETAKASQNVREDLSTFLKGYATNLDDLYQAIDQNPCKTWGVASTPIGLQYPFPTQRTIDEFFDNFDDDLLYSVKLLTQYITYINECERKAKEEYYRPLAVFPVDKRHEDCYHIPGEAQRLRTLHIRFGKRGTGTEGDREAFQGGWKLGELTPFLRGVLDCKCVYW